MSALITYRNCLQRTITDCEESEVKCPYASDYDCQEPLSWREICAVTSKKCDTTDLQETPVLEVKLLECIICMDSYKEDAVCFMYFSIKSLLYIICNSYR